MASFYKDDYISAEFLNPNVIKVTFSEITPDEVMFNNYLHFLEDIYSKKIKFILVYDSCKSKYLPSDMRVKLGLWFKKNNEIVKNYNYHTVFIINSIMIRLVLNGIFLVEKPIYTYDIVSNLEEAQKIVDIKLKTI